MKFLECKACGAVFTPISALHYVAREDGQNGIAAAFESNPEEQWYDAFDCPNCGAQNITNVRMREVETTWRELCTQDTARLPASPRRRPRNSSVVLSARSRHMKAERAFLLTM